MKSKGFNRTIYESCKIIDLIRFFWHSHRLC